MIPPLELDGITYDRAAIEEVRKDVIDLRDEALQNLEVQFGPQDAIFLSQTVALLTHLRNNTERGPHEQ